MSFQDPAQEFTENYVVNILTSVGISCHRNNLDDIKAVDIVTDTGVAIDAQYSNNFAKYGDCRLDIVSVFTPRQVTIDHNYVYDHTQSFFHNFQNKYHCTVNKIGKIFLSNYVDELCILFYNEYFSSDAEPDYILLFSCKKLIQEFRANPEYYFDKIVLNNKYGLSDRFGSAFIPINARELAKATGGFFGTVQEFREETGQKNTA